MQIAPNDLAELHKILQDAKEILVMTPTRASIDRMAASLAFYLALPQMGKRVTIASPQKVTVDISNLVGIDKVTDGLGNKNFIVSLDYVEGSIEKVSYNIEGDKFNLVIEPRPGFTFSADKIQYSHGGTNADVVIVVGASKLEDLDPFASEIKKLTSTKVVNIDIQAQNVRYGQLNLVFPGMGSFSEVVASLLSQLGITLDADNATNLLSGISQATENFTLPQTTPDSFEAAATLLRLGAQKTPQLPVGRPDGGFTSSPFSPRMSRYQSPLDRPQGKPFGGMPPMSQPRSSSPKPYPTVFVQQPPQSQLDEEQVDTATLNPSEAPAPPDWLKPKIFRSRAKPITPPPGYSPNDGKGGLS